MSDVADAVDIASKSLSVLAPAAQFVVALGVVAFAFFSAIWFMLKGERERKREASGHGSIEIPGFLMGGPVYEAIQSVNDLAEEARKASAADDKVIAILMDIAKNMERMNQGQAYTHKILEASFTEEQIRKGLPWTRG